MINHHDHFGLRRRTSKFGRYTPFLQYGNRNHASIQSAGRRREPRKNGYHIFSHRDRTLISKRTRRYDQQKDHSPAPRPQLWKTENNMYQGIVQLNRRTLHVTRTYSPEIKYEIKKLQLQKF